MKAAADIILPPKKHNELIQKHTLAVYEGLLVKV